MKRYLLFAGDYGNEHGGAHDLQCAYDNIDEVKKAVRDVFFVHHSHEWVHVYDVLEEKFVKINLNER